MMGMMYLSYKALPSSKERCDQKARRACRYVLRGHVYSWNWKKFGSLIFWLLSLLYLLLLLWWRLYSHQGGYFHPNRKWMCLSDVENLTFYTNFLPSFPPISIPFLKEKHPILTKLGAFYNNLLKIHPSYIFVSDENPLITIPNFVKKQAHIRIPCQFETSPPPPITLLPFWNKREAWVVGCNCHWHCILVQNLKRRP